MTKHPTTFTLSLVASIALALAAGCGKGGGGGGGKLGVAECDAYLDKMAACAAKKGGKTGEQLTKMRDMMANAWRDSAKNADQKGQLPGVCTSAIEDMKKQVADCDW